MILRAKSPARRRSLLPRLVMALLAGGLFLIGYQWGNHWQQRYESTPSIEGVRLLPPIPLPAWELEDETGQLLDSQDLAEFWVLIGFAALEDLTGHLALTRMIDIFNRLADRPKVREQLRLLLVSPHRNNTLAQDFQRLLPQLRLLTGTAEQRARLRSLLDAPEPEAEDRTHQADGTESLSLYLMNPEGALTAVFPPAQPAARVAVDIQRLADTPAREP